MRKGRYLVKAPKGPKEVIPQIRVGNRYEPKPTTIELCQSKKQNAMSARMSDESIYQYVREKLKVHGVEKTKGGRLILSDKELFSLFVALERAKRNSSFDAVQSAADKIESHLISLGKKELIAFAYLYIRFSDFTPKKLEPDELLPDGHLRKSAIFATDVTNEQMLIGLWARVKYDAVGEKFLQAVYRGG